MNIIKKRYFLKKKVYIMWICMKKKRKSYLYIIALNFSSTCQWFNPNCYVSIFYLPSTFLSLSRAFSRRPPTGFCRLTISNVYSWVAFKIALCFVSFFFFPLLYSNKIWISCNLNEYLSITFYKIYKSNFLT